MRVCGELGEGGGVEFEWTDCGGVGACGEVFGAVGEGVGGGEGGGGCGGGGGGGEAEGEEGVEGVFGGVRGCAALIRKKDIYGAYRGSGTDVYNAIVVHI